jgi:hypothetical protein
MHVRILLAAWAAALMASGCESRLQWVKPEGVSPEGYNSDLAQCSDEASVLSAQDLSGMPTGAEKTSALAMRRPIHFRACMVDKGYSRVH